MKYILVTAARDEAANLPNLLESVISQIVKPSYWLIMNDNSSDKTFDIIKEYSEKYDFIHYLNLEKADRDLSWRYHKIMNLGFERAISHCEKINIDWSYVGVLDGDIFFRDNDYYYRLLSEFDKINNLGIVSGNIYSFDGKSYLLDRNKYNFPRGANRLIGRSCFFQIGGYPVTPCADSVMRIKSEKQGYCCDVLGDAFAYQSRSATGSGMTFRSGLYVGGVKYYLGYPIIYFFAKFCSDILRFRLSFAFGFLINVTKSYFWRKEKINDSVVVEYYRAKYSNPFKIFNK